ncbi:preprotein translocase subunit YajC [Anaplasma bovis]|uniref:preprotein translocase subunit YajC n=1 Tax=Anaplasma bovis TaxID=186733 RepID=UPI002FF316E9
MFFGSSAAAASSASTAPGIGASVAGFVPLILIFCVFYFLVIRPQQKKLKEHSKLLDSLKKGDKVIAAGGILGTVTKVDNSSGYLHVEVCSNTEIKVLKSSVSDVLNGKGSSKTAATSTAVGTEQQAQKKA